MTPLDEYRALSEWLAVTDEPCEVRAAVIFRCDAVRTQIMTAPPSDVAAILAKVVILAETFAEDCDDNSDVARAFASAIAGLEAMLPPPPAAALVKAA